MTLDRRQLLGTSAAALATEGPVLMRVDFDAGQGMGSIRAQQDRKSADAYAFLLWQKGGRA